VGAYTQIAYMTLFEKDLMLKKEKIHASLPEALKSMFNRTNTLFDALYESVECKEKCASHRLIPLYLRCFVSVLQLVLQIYFVYAL
jgi:hypothetical protein